MRPAFRITFDGTDLTQQVRERLLSLVISDAIGMVNDTLTLSITDHPDDEGEFVPLPTHGSTIEVELGYEEGEGIVNPFKGLKAMGTFAIDEVELSEGSDGGAMTITARATDTNFSFVKKPRNDNGAWRNIKLADIVVAIAKRNNLEPRVHKDVGNFIMVINQTNQSDSAFLSDLATDYNCVFKVQAGNLYFAPSDKLAEVMLPTIAPDDVFVNKSDTEGYRFVWQGRSNFTGVKARWKSTDAATTGEERSYVTKHQDGSECWFMCSEEFTSQAEASAAANSRKRQLDFQRAKLYLECIGYPLLMSGSILHLRKGFRPGIPPDWRIITAHHRFTDSGYTTSVEAEVKDVRTLEQIAQKPKIPKTKKTTIPADAPIDEEASFGNGGVEGESSE